jgi:hypothetical protein
MQSRFVDTSLVALPIDLSEAISVMHHPHFIVHCLENSADISSNQAFCYLGAAERDGCQ